MSIFYVYQGKSYKYERAKGYLFSPKLNKSGAKNAGYTMMTNVKKDDFIIHNCNGKIVAVSIAKEDCSERLNPSQNIQTNQSTGYYISTNYFDIENPLIVTKYKDWLSSNYKDGSAFTVNGTGKQRYMCAIDYEHAVFLLENTLKLQTSQNIKDVLNRILLDIADENNSEYDGLEKDEINSLVETISKDKLSWTSKKEKQAVILSSTIGREKPKRNTKVAANALAYADFLCEYNKDDATFLRKNGKPYTEPHHLIPISKYRDFNYSVDVMENIVSLCSYCHNLLHYGRLEDKEPILKKLYNDRIKALKNVGLDLSFEQLKNYYV